MQVSSKVDGIAKKTLNKAKDVKDGDDVLSMAMDFVASLDPKYRDGLNELVKDPAFVELREMNADNLYTKGVPTLFKYANQIARNKKATEFFN